MGGIDTVNGPAKRFARQTLSSGQPPAAWRPMPVRAHVAAVYSPFALCPPMRLPGLVPLMRRLWIMTSGSGIAVWPAQSRLTEPTITKHSEVTGASRGSSPTRQPILKWW